DRGQSDIERKAVNGVAGAKRVPQPTVFDGENSPAQPTSSGISIDGFNGAMSKLMTGPSPILLGSESGDLQDKFKKFAQGGGDKNLIDTMTERASLAAAIRLGVKSAPAENKLLASLDLASGPK
ncbi:MAG: hypothetical protein DI586_10495, partial [Micavibrio aeruginosavorus]